MYVLWIILIIAFCATIGLTSYFINRNIQRNKLVSEMSEDDIKRLNIYILKNNWLRSK